MKLADALQVIHATRSSEMPLFRVNLCCGFTPLHLRTYFHAHLQTRLPDRRVEIAAGLYGDLVGNVTRAATDGPDAAAVVVEWEDIEPRLGYRQLGGWRPTQGADIVEGARNRLQQLAQALLALQSQTPVTVALPGLPMAPAFSSVTAKWSSYAVQLEAAVASFAAELSLAGISLVHPHTLDRISPPGLRRNAKAELLTGFPYSTQHADALGTLLAVCIGSRQSPKKGIITDLDDTVWHGILGDAGLQGVTWNLETHSQLHALYQQMLSALAEQGVLLAIASKNDPALVDQVLRERQDLLMPAASIFPLEVHWGPKSESVTRILETWNIGADSVVFIDDSPLEIAEVKSMHPGMECILFPKADYQAMIDFLFQLRDLFGKDTVSKEDGLRMESIRRSHQLHTQSTGPAQHQEDFLKTLDASITFTLQPPATEGRILELVNKTNQFNLNGRRYSEAEWQRLRSEPGNLVLAIGYQDKFGPLGTIAVLAGVRDSADFRVHTWVMSCRAFSRRIEYQTLQFLFEHFALERIVFDLESTSRNGPLRESLVPLLENEPVGMCAIDRQDFRSRCPDLAHRVEVQDTSVQLN
jgi:FkbH-like protein